MAAISQQLADITVLSIVVRILLSTFCAGTLGFERERHNQAAGLSDVYHRDATLRALVMMTNIFGCRPRAETDLVRMSASVITGLGFLGAGTILVTAQSGGARPDDRGWACGRSPSSARRSARVFTRAASSAMRSSSLRCKCCGAWTFASARRSASPLCISRWRKKSTVGQIIRQIKGHGHYIWDLNLFSETQEKSGGPVCGTFTLWVNGKTTLDEEIQALEALDGVSYMTLM